MGPIKLPVSVCSWGRMWGLRDATGIEYFCEGDAEHAIKQIAAALNAAAPVEGRGADPAPTGEQRRCELCQGSGYTREMGDYMTEHGEAELCEWCGGTGRLQPAPTEPPAAGPDLDAERKSLLAALFQVLGVLAHENDPRPKLAEAMRLCGLAANEEPLGCDPIEALLPFELRGEPPAGEPGDGEEHWESVRDRRRAEAESREGWAHINRELELLRELEYIVRLGDNLTPAATTDRVLVQLDALRARAGGR